MAIEKLEDKKPTTIAAKVDELIEAVNKIAFYTRVQTTPVAPPVTPVGNPKVDSLLVRKAGEQPGEGDHQLTGADKVGEDVE